ncbi:hypothetical protein IJ00_19380 [Calothrix sp. 336/3]|uniref:hypothetical protein n=1 Tax=Calothrix sp. 336/3 TaxID=1337936 RepID=UPI0004E3E2B9|nr:hypothetical protein [Calothrix sp. 336/3]AKG23147.1 hypothetical protein IJ00_19380 [Calothrix sp. 336/3]
MHKKRYSQSRKVDPFIKFFFARIPGQIATTFTQQQLIELKRIFGKGHPISIHIPIPLARKYFYLELISVPKNKNNTDR